MKDTVRWELREKQKAISIACMGSEQGSRLKSTDTAEDNQYDDTSEPSDE